MKKSLVVSIIVGAFLAAGFYLEYDRSVYQQPRNDLSNSNGVDVIVTKYPARINVEFNSSVLGGCDSTQRSAMTKDGAISINLETVKGEGPCVLIAVTSRESVDIFQSPLLGSKSLKITHGSAIIFEGKI